MNIDKINSNTSTAKGELLTVSATEIYGPLYPVVQLH